MRKDGEEGSAQDTQWTLFEVFVQERTGEPHQHAGSVRAPDPEMALQNARDVYARRGPVASLWVVPSGAIAATSPSDAGPFFDPAEDKVYRHPQFYRVPRVTRRKAPK
ncbi:MAG: 1,2-phenylacetyl-CoA epoxidase subunit B [Acidobacteria bacterium]|nr:MAG: 1,2-phenylacetyl-CoA epoxidase subunit B [Acidobacteriota bacterium]